MYKANSVYPSVPRRVFAVHGEQRENEGLGVLRLYIPRRQPRLLPRHLLRVREVLWETGHRQLRTDEWSSRVAVIGTNCLIKTITQTLSNTGSDAIQVAPQTEYNSNVITDDYIILTFKTGGPRSLQLVSNVIQKDTENVNNFKD